MINYFKYNFFSLIGYEIDYKSGNYVAFADRTICIINFYKFDNMVAKLKIKSEVINTSTLDGLLRNL